MQEMLGCGFLTTDGEEWIGARNGLKPACNRNNTDGFETLEKVNDKLLERIEERGGVVDMGSLLFDAVSGLP